MSALTVALATLLTAAGPPHGVQVQGSLRAAGGTAVDGKYGLEIRLFPSEEGGDALVEMIFSGVTVTDGVFSVLVEPVGPDLVQQADEIWVEFIVAGEPPLPRSRLWSAPFALVSAQSLSLACTGCVGTAQLADGVVDALLGEGSVSAAQLADGAVTASKLGIVCPASAVLKYTDGAWACGTDTVGAPSPWTALDGGGLTYEGGKVGLGVAAPAAALSVSGAVQPGTTDAECAEPMTGAVRWAGASSTLEVCDGTTWRPIFLGGGACAAATEGSLRYNAAEKQMEYCDGESWQPISDPCLGNVYTSCADVLESGCSKGSGTYSVDLDGVGGEPATLVWCDMTTKDGGWTLFARIYEENDHSKYGFDSLANGWETGEDTLVSIEGLAFEEMIFIRRDTGEFYYVDLQKTVTWPHWGDPFNAGNGYTISNNPDHPGQYIRAYDADPGKHYQLCFRENHQDECGPTSADDISNYGDGGGNDGQNMLWAGNEVNAIGTGITWDFGVR